MSIGAGPRSASTRTTSAAPVRSRPARHRQRRSREFPGLPQHVIDRADIRILVYLHISFAGIYAFSRTSCSARATISAADGGPRCSGGRDANRDVIIGIKVRLGRHASGPARHRPADVALQVADETGLPLMAHIDEPPPTYEAVVEQLRPGDVLTHCYRPFPNAPVTADGRVKPAVLAARERGVFFDSDHGMGSFSWKTARAMLKEVFGRTRSHPTSMRCASTARSTIRSPPCRNFCALGMSLTEVIAASTVNAARVLGRPELGTLTVGSPGDASSSRCVRVRFRWKDVTRRHRHRRGSGSSAHGLVIQRSRLSGSDTAIDGRGAVGGKSWMGRPGTGDRFPGQLHRGDWAATEPETMPAANPANRRRHRAASRKSRRDASRAPWPPPRPRQPTWGRKTGWDALRSVCASLGHRRQSPSGSRARCRWNRASRWRRASGEVKKAADGFRHGRPNW